MLTYCLQVYLYTGLFYAVYCCTLRNTPYHAYSRAMLQLSVVLPLFIPLLHLPATVAAGLPQSAAMPVLLPEIIAGVSRPAAPYLIFPAAATAYAAVSLLLLCMFLFRLLQLRHTIRHSETERRDGYTIVRRSAYGPGSWWRYIFLPVDDTDPRIMAHELGHVRHRHSADILLLQLLQIACWPNIFLWPIRRELRQVHEFQADSVVDTDRQGYAAMLVSSLLSCSTSPLIHSFIIHPIKRRIMMLQKQGTRPSRRRAAAAAIITFGLLAGGLIGVQSCTNANKQSTEPAMTEQQHEAYVTSVLKDSIKDVKKYLADHNQPAGSEMTGQNADPYFNKVSTYADIRPEFHGDISEFLSKNLVYPAGGFKGDGRVFIKFVINEHGKVILPEDESQAVLRSSDPALSRIAMNAIKKMPDWTPGTTNGKPVAVYFVQPVTFKAE